ncbi:MAG: hypothetical protein PHG48_06825, partial [Eubacteriales bacterium]|nr:hypothetical protein [Eubacteriales bacterium]
NWIKVVYEEKEDEKTPAKTETAASADKYRKYDKGFFEFDYANLYYEENNEVVTYFNKSTKSQEGMKLFFTDASRKLIKSVSYYLPGSGGIAAAQVIYNSQGSEKDIRIGYVDINGQRQDHYYGYDDSGKLMYEQHVIDGKREGSWKDYKIVNGVKVLYEMNYKNNEYDGTYKEFHWLDDGTIVQFMVAEYKNGEMISSEYNDYMRDK